MRYFYIISLLIFIIFLPSCTPCIDGPMYGYCKTEKDCKIRFYCGYSKEYDKKICMENRCKDEHGNSKELCGMGKCVPCGDWDESCKDIRTKRGYACQCDEGTVLYDEDPDKSYGDPVCVPKCDSNYTGVCEKASSGKFKEQIGNYIYCNLELGHCADRCQGEGSCPDDFICYQESSYGYCKNVFDCKKNGDCSIDETYICGLNGRCLYNPCWKHNYYCGAGKCIGGANESQIIDDNPEYGRTYTCDCDENTVLYKGVCMPICTDDKPCDALEKDSSKTFYCDKEKGHCVE